MLIFAKYPEPGAVMTRLCPPLMPEEAAAVQRACIRLCCERAFRSWPVRPVLAVSPDDAEAKFREIVGPYICIIGQGEGDLGERLVRTAAAVLGGDDEPLLVIGTDSPTMPDRLIESAQSVLRRNDLVLGPCEDGGYYLIGFKRVHPRIFEDIDWSSDQVLSQTRARAAASGLTLGLLEPWYDIDRPADLERAESEIERNRSRDAYELLRVIQTVRHRMQQEPAGARENR